MTLGKPMNDAQIRAIVSYVVRYLNKNCPEQLETMIHLIGHDERYRKRVSEITEAIIDHHDKLFMGCSSGKKIEELTPEYAEQCEVIRKKMRKLVDEYLSEYSKPN
jgi:alcohol dehydrogenase class IV